jgi:hypothetical protein
MKALQSMYVVLDGKHRRVGLAEKHPLAPSGIILSLYLSAPV